MARHQDDLDLLAKEHENIHTFTADLTILAQRRALVEAVGDLDILVNNAGIGIYRNLEYITEAQYRKMFELNVFAPLDLTQQFLPALRERKKAHIVNVGSLAGYVSFPPITYYSMTKYALRAFSTGLRGELKGSGITVALITPGPVDTGFRSMAVTADDSRHYLRGHGVPATHVSGAVIRSIRRRHIPGYQSISVPRIGGLARLASLPFGDRIGATAGRNYDLEGS